MAEVPTTTTTGWGRAAGEQLATTTASTIAAQDAARDARARLLTLVATHATPWIEAFIDAIEINVDGLNATMSYPLVRMNCDVHAGIVLTASDRNEAHWRMTPEFAPGDVDPLLRIAETRRGLRQLTYWRFADAGDQGLRLRVFDSALDPHDAARALVAPWLAALDVLDQERAWRAMLERWVMDPIRLVRRSGQTDGVIVAAATPAEISVICELDVAICPTAWTLGLFRAAIRDGAVYLARPRGAAHAIGFCVVSHIRDREIAIVRLAVHPDERRKGLASRLLERVLTDAKKQGVTRAVLDVAKSNEPAQRFYEALKFTRGVRAPGE